MSLRIYTIDDEAVRDISKEVTLKELESDKMQQFIDELVDAMERFDGIGIAACQVGHTVRIFVVDKHYSKTDEHLVFINPRLVSLSEKKNTMEEGCLSVPGVYGPIERATKVRVKALDRNGKSLDIKAKGMYARILQHESDHLEGVLYIDKAIRTNKKEREQPILKHE